jgi:hypothetical protein
MRAGRGGNDDPAALAAVSDGAPHRFVLRAVRVRGSAPCRAKGSYEVKFVDEQRVVASFTDENDVDFAVVLRLVRVHCGRSASARLTANAR